jgi:hypothetical protein
MQSVARPALQAGGSGFEPRTVHHAGVAQLAEREFSKLDIVGSRPTSRSKPLHLAGCLQLQDTKAWKYGNKETGM